MYKFCRIVAEMASRYVASQMIFFNLKIGKDLNYAMDKWEQNIASSDSL